MTTARRLLWLAALFLIASEFLQARNEPPVPIHHGKNVPWPAPTYDLETRKDLDTWQRCQDGFFVTANAVRKVAAGVTLSRREALAFEPDGKTLKPDVLSAMKWAIINNETDVDDARTLREAYEALQRTTDTANRSGERK